MATSPAPGTTDLAGPDPRRAAAAAADLAMADEWRARLEAELADADRLRDLALAELAVHTLPLEEAGPACDVNGEVLEPEPGVIIERLPGVKTTRASVKPGGLEQHHESLEPLGLHQHEVEVPATTKVVRPSVGELTKAAAKLRAAGVPLVDLVDDGETGPPRFRVVRA